MSEEARMRSHEVVKTKKIRKSQTERHVKEVCAAVLNAVSTANCVLFGPKFFAFQIGRAHV